MRILMMSQAPQRRGAETFGAQLRDGLVVRGHQAKIIYLYSYNGTEPIELRGEDECLEFEETHPLERWLTLNPRLLKRVRDEIRAFEPDVLHLNGARSVKYGALASFGSSCRVVYRNIDSPRFWNSDWKRQFYYRHVIFPLIDGVAGVSERTLEEVRELYALRPERTEIEFIPNAIELAHLADDGSDVRARHGIPHDALIVLFFGKLAPQKRPDRWIEAFAQLKGLCPRAHGLIVGDGPLRAEVEFAARQRGVADSVTFAGYQRAVGPYLSAADVLLLSSDTEGIPAAVLEAGYMGVPTVSARVGGVDECIRHGRTGVLVDHLDAAALARATAKVLEDASALERMGTAAHDFVASTFLMESIVPRYEALYERVRS